MNHVSVRQKTGIMVWIIPSIHQSGNSLYRGRMKYGNKKVRWILIQAANTAARNDDRLRKSLKDMVVILQ